DLDKALRRRPDRCAPDPVFARSATGGVGVAPVALAALLVFDAHPMDLAAGAFLGGAGPPVLDVAGDVDPLDLGIDRMPAAGALLQIVGDVHLVRAALVLRLGGAVAGMRRGGHRIAPHFSS